MKKYIITYGNQGFEAARERFVRNASETGVFDEVTPYSEDMLTQELLQSDVMKEKRGGGLWSWKPDIILTALGKMNDGDYLVYCDAGCTVYKSREWERIWQQLTKCDIIAQLIYQRTDRWTRRSIVAHFRKANSKGWSHCHQFLATVIIIKATPFTRMMMTEWRSLMISHPEMVSDVKPEERRQECDAFIENRHDQAIFSALVYKYLNQSEYKDRIKVQWEHIEDYDPIFKQSVRATRYRNGESSEGTAQKAKAILKRIIKDYLLRPLLYAPRQWYYSRL